MYVPRITYSNEVNLIKMFEVTPIYADIDRPSPPHPPFLQYPSVVQLFEKAFVLIFLLFCGHSV